MTNPVFGGEGKDIKQEGSEGKNFDLQAKSYAGPDNFVPANKGTVNPDDIQKSSPVGSMSEVYKGGIPA